MAHVAIDHDMRLSISQSSVMQLRKNAYEMKNREGGAKNCLIRSRKAHALPTAVLDVLVARVVGKTDSKAV